MGKIKYRVQCEYANIADICEQVRVLLWSFEFFAPIRERTLKRLSSTLQDNAQTPRKYRKRTQKARQWQ